MSEKRKRKLEKRQDKKVRELGERKAVFMRLLKVMDLGGAFRNIPADVLEELFYNQVEPPILVVTDPDSPNSDELARVIPTIRRLIQKPWRVNLDGREYEMAFQDLFRGYFAV
jgi:hypothetical protein